jgi:hypothetical protein
MTMVAVVTPAASEARAGVFPMPFPFPEHPDFSKPKMTVRAPLVLPVAHGRTWLAFG